MKFFPLLCAALLACVCQFAPAATHPASASRKNEGGAIHSVVRINATLQGWNPSQPWEKSTPANRRALGAIVGPQRVITSSEMAADATYLELESPDGTRLLPAKVLAVDYEANLALLGPQDDRQAAAFFAGTTPLAIAPPPSIGDTFDLLQIEENGTPLATQGTLRQASVSGSFLSGQFFLTFEVKASMQSASSSFSLPALRDGKLIGILSSYDTKDQTCQVVATDIITRFLDAAAKSPYRGFPSLGMATATTEDAPFRRWLKLPEDDGGLYITFVRKGGAAEAAGVKVGDVMTGIGDHVIDRRGYYQHERYGNLYWSHLVRGERITGETVKLHLLRDGKPLDLDAKLTREEPSSRLVPSYTFDTAPSYLVKGGLVFQELTQPLLESYGENWESQAPLNLLDVARNQDKRKGNARRIVFLSGSIPTPATVGYERLRNMIVTKVNGREILDMKSMVDAFQHPENGLYRIEFEDETISIYLDDEVTTRVDQMLQQRGIAPLYRAN